VIELDLLEQVFMIIGMLALVVWLYFWSRNIKGARDIVHFLKLKSRPWVGPTDSSIIYATKSDDEKNFSITLKNFGQIKAKNVKVYFTAQDQKPSKAQLNASNISKSNLGSLMPQLQTDYSFVVDSNKIQKAKTNGEPLFVGLYFSYEFGSTKSGYGLISEYNPQSRSFERMETWDD